MKAVHENKIVLILSESAKPKRTTLVRRQEKRFVLALAAAAEYEIFLSQIVGDNYWTKWNTIYDLNGELIGYYRTNNKKVQFRFNYLSSKYQGTSFCHKEDSFDLATGISIALNRSLKKKFRCKRKFLISYRERTIK